MCYHHALLPCTEIAAYHVHRDSGCGHMPPPARFKSHVPRTDYICGMPSVIWHSVLFPPRSRESPRTKHAARLPPTDSVPYPVNRPFMPFSLAMRPRPVALTIRPRRSCLHVHGGVGAPAWHLQWQLQWNGRPHQSLRLHHIRLERGAPVLRSHPSRIRLHVVLSCSTHGLEGRRVPLGGVYWRRCRLLAARWSATSSREPCG